MEEEEVDTKLHHSTSPAFFSFLLLCQSKERKEGLDFFVHFKNVQENSCQKKVALEEESVQVLWQLLSFSDETLSSQVFLRDSVCFS